MDKGMILRDIEARDASALVELYPHWGNQLARRRIERTMLFRGERRIVAEISGKTIAHVKIDYGSGVHSHIARIYSLIVAKEHRGKGIARALLEKAINEMPAGIEIVTLETQADNAPARSLFEKLGFEEYGFLENAWKKGNEYKDNVLYKKVLR